MAIADVVLQQQLRFLARSRLINDTTCGLENSSGETNTLHTKKAWAKEVEFRVYCIVVLAQYAFIDLDVTTARRGW